MQRKRIKPYIWHIFMLGEGGDVSRFGERDDGKNVIGGCPGDVGLFVNLEYGEREGVLGIDQVCVRWIVWDCAQWK